MKVAKLTLTIIAIMSFPWALYAQGNSDFYTARDRFLSRQGLGFRAGSNYSIPYVAASEALNPISLPYIAGLVPRFGFYLSGYVYKDLPDNQLALRLDATLQLKKIGTADPRTNLIVEEYGYYYLGITPLIGLRFSPKLTVWTGLEANVQLARHNQYPSTIGNLLEVGTTIRVAYFLGQFGLEAGYFRGFTPMDKSEAFRPPGSSVTNNFYNQTLQLGILFRLDR